jgi:hypothetical protein
MEPVDWLARVEQATRSRAQAQTELDRFDVAWRQAVADAMRATGVPRRRIAAQAGISEARAYQIRDGRR